MNTIKVEEHNNKSVGRNVPMAKCHKAITKEQFSIARSQNEMTEVQFVSSNSKMPECKNKITKCNNTLTKKQDSVAKNLNTSGKSRFQ